MEQTTIKIGNKIYDVKIARTEQEKTIGLSKTKKLAKDEGMLFEYTEPNDVVFTMEDTSIPLDIIFIDEEGVVVKVFSEEAYSDDDIEMENILYVLEVNINSGIKEGDELEEIEEDDTISEDDKQLLTQSKMLVLDSEGNVQYRLQGGERIFSRIMTRKMIKLALIAYKSDNDADYKKLGKLVFKELQAQDSRETEYVELDS